MGIQASYLGMSLSIADLDQDNLAYFQFCADRNFHLQRCADCGLFRYPPTSLCPWCMSRNAKWEPVGAEGTVHSYTVVRHAIQPGMKDLAPYAVLIVDLDAQKGKPSPEEALRVVGNLATEDGKLAPSDLVTSIRIGARVRMTFTHIAPGLALPQWVLA